MSDRSRSPDAATKMLWLSLGLLLCALTAYLLRCHFVKAYSDPTGWIGMAEHFWYHDRVSRWSVVFAMYLILPLKLLGLQYTFISNLPWIILFSYLTYSTTALSCRQDQAKEGQVARQCALVATVALVFVSYNLFRELLNPYREIFAFTLLIGTFTCALMYARRPYGGLIIVSGAIFGLGVGVREPNAIAAISLLYLYLGYLYKEQPKNVFKLPALFLGGSLIGLIPFFIQNHKYSGYWWIPNYLYENVEPLLEQLYAHGAMLLQMALLTLVAVGLLLFALSVLITGKRWKPTSRGSAAEVRAYQATIRNVAVGFTIIFFAGLFVVTRFDLVPGMFYDRFAKVGPKTWRYICGEMGHFGMICFFFGILYAWVRRYYALLLLCLPSFITYLYFWSFYGYVKPRYVFTIEVFMFPLMGVGFVGLFSALGAVLRFLPRPSLRQAATVCAALLVCGHLGLMAFRGTDGCKVWHLPAARKALMENLEEPFMFDCDRNHHAQMLAVAAGDNFSERFAHNNAIFTFRRMDRPAEDLDGLLRNASQRMFQRLQEGNLYSYGRPKRMMAKMWFDGIPAFDLSTIQPPLRVYNETMDGKLYRIAPWQSTTLGQTFSVEAPGRHLLGIDAYRLWDYTNRTFARAAINDQPVVDRLSNHFQWVECEIDKRTAHLALTSDAGLPAHPHVVVYGLDDTIKINLGARNDAWYRNYLSSHFQRERLMHRTAAMLMDEGQVYLPNFASTNHDVFVKLHYEFYQEDLRYRGDPHDMSMTTEHDALSVRLPGKNVSASATLSLGSGQGKLVMTPVDFKTTLPSFRSQQRMRKRGAARRFGYVKLYNAEIWSVPAYIEGSFALQADVKAEPYLDKGFYPAEKDREGYFRWTAPEAQLHIPKTIAPQGYQLVIETRDFRPPEFRHTPVFSFNDTRATAERIVSTDGRTHYRLNTPQWRTDQPNVVGIRTKAWNPQTDSGLGDTRDLGIVITALRVDAVVN